MTQTPFHVVFAIFDQITQLDFTGPAQFLCRMPGAQVHVASATLDPVVTDVGFAIVPTTTFADCPQADLLCVPGGLGVAPALSDAQLINFVRNQASEAQWVTSVCTGAFILGRAGLLQGRRATTHWGYTGLLPMVGAVREDARTVFDGNVVTAGGVTSGIDFALTIIAELHGEDVARSLQLNFEYDPAPPFAGGTPATSPKPIVAMMRERFYDARAAEMEAALNATA
ncbi:cyclohexyl-isocyanide hydratase [Blastomonas natatoria]|uniref:Cyclohexyl-isocyanide hydratase n=1 Tax=Blastomonas natatoria TaxID=34015 RepID=A0A2V3V107_9SPHN|nr:DJ-1/PfpI family protein [Blastomonas natatoria]PXW75210.1 cyclohexyl-isocyanide hydratase [Blastomonas natatoria]